MQEENARLRKRIKQLEIERDILSKSNGLVRTRDRFDPVKVFEFVKAHQALWPVVTQCRVLGVSTSGYYAWLKRKPRNAVRTISCSAIALELSIEIRLKTTVAHVALWARSLSPSEFTWKAQ
jgi:hypothetical protein